ncbi:TonB-dependent receptor [Porphyromonadaceae bacterium W3.11]|nr:TonB-dependent receptor [Porphyromonadaceae bacterium W3.11]
MSLKKVLITVFLCLSVSCFSNIQVTQAQTVSELKISVLDEETDDPLPNVIVKTNDKVYITDMNGVCVVPNDHKNKIVLSLKLLGFKEIVSQTFSTKGRQQLTIKLSPASEMLDEVSVTAQRRHTTLLQQAVAIDAASLEKSASVSLAKMLEQIPGVSTISTGGTIAKPVIQGMHSSRILLVNNGVRLESQSWGDDHAPEIDHTGATIVEVIKGAEAVRYGYGAMGGVVIFNQAPLPYGSERFKVNGKVNLGYLTNGRGFDSSASVEMGYKNFGLRLHGMYQKAGDYSTAEYILNNTGYNNISFSGLLGYKNKHFNATIYGSIYSSRSGIYYASKISDIDQLIARFEAGRPDESSFRPFSYKLEPPFQQSQHVTIKGDFKYDINEDHNLELKVSYQDNLRQEFENRKKADLSWIPVQDLMLTTFNGELGWDGKWNVLGMETQAGVSWLYQYNYNIPGTKQPAFIPNFTALTMGGYLIHKITLDRLMLSAGMRYDVRAQAISGYTTMSSYKYYDEFRTYRNFTGTLAAHYQFNDNFDMRTNIGWSWRPPDINELYATGLNHGAYWIVGNKDLESERGYKAVLGGSYHNSWLSIDPSCFYQHVQNYIYDSIGKGNNRFHNHPSGKYPKFIYEQDEARFWGGDLIATAQVMEGLKVSAKGEWIVARNLTQDTWLPFMPSDRYGLSSNYEWTWGDDYSWHAEVNLEGSYVTKQKRFDPTKDLVPDSPPAYFLLNGSAEATKDLGHGKSIKVMLLGDNILNTLYKEYTDRFRFYAHARGAQITLKTIFSF